MGKFRAKRNRSLVANAKKIYALLQPKTQVQWQWVKGHSGTKHNEHADKLAEKGKQNRIIWGKGGSRVLLHAGNAAIGEYTASRCTGGYDRNNVEDFHAHLMSAEEITCKKQRYAPRSAWITSELAEKLQIAKIELAEHDPTGEDGYRRAKSQARKIKRDWVRTNLEQAQNTSEATLWHASGTLKKGFRERKTRLKRNGKPVPWSKTHEVVAEHQATVQWGPSSVTDTEIETLMGSAQLHQPAGNAPTEFTMEELEYVIPRLKKNKARGPDEVRAEIILLLNYWGQQELLKTIDHCFREQSTAIRKKALIVSIYKRKRPDPDPVNLTYFPSQHLLQNLRFLIAHPISS